MNKKLEKLVKLLDFNKCENINVLDVRGMTYISDYFIISTIKNKPHAEAICRLIDELFADEPYLRIEGKSEGEWVLIDAGEMIIHLFQAETRAFYNLDGLWGDAKPVDISMWLIED